MQCVPKCTNSNDCCNRNEATVRLDSLVLQLQSSIYVYNDMKIQVDYMFLLSFTVGKREAVWVLLGGGPPLLEPRHPWLEVWPLPPMGVWLQCMVVEEVEGHQCMGHRHPCLVMVCTFVCMSLCSLQKPYIYMSSIRSRNRFLVATAVDREIFVLKIFCV